MKRFPRVRGRSEEALNEDSFESFRCFDKMDGSKKNLSKFVSHERFASRVQHTGKVEDMKTEYNSTFHCTSISCRKSVNMYNAHIALFEEMYSQTCG